MWWDDELSDKLKEVKKNKRLFRKRSSAGNGDVYLRSKQEFFDMYCRKHQDFLTRRIEFL